MKLPYRILLLDDDENALVGIGELLSAQRAMTSRLSRRYEDAKKLLTPGAYDLLITDVRLRGFNGLHLVMKVRDESPETGVVIMTGYDEPLMRARGEPLQRTVRQQADQGRRAAGSGSTQLCPACGANAAGRGNESSAASA